MESFLTRYRSLLVLCAVLLTQVIGLATQMHRVRYPSREDGHHVRAARSWAAYTIAPVENAFWHMGHAVRGAWSGYVDLRHVRQHDKDLQYQIDQLRLQQAALLEDARQGQRLQNLLAFKQHYLGKTIAAQVIGTGGGDQSRLLILNKGRNDGLQPDMAVITPDGIVGKIRDIFPDSAQLLLLNDSSSGVGVILANVRSRGVLRGMADGRIQINTLLPDDRIKPGEPVVTSGGDRVFPRGLSVGTVQSVSLDPEHQPYASIIIRPASNLDRLEEVLVVTDTAQQFAATAVNTDPPERETELKASEIVAERLPGLHDTKPDGTAADKTNEAAKQPSTDPNAKPEVKPIHPTPTLHTDRYTPGSVPNAGELRPGERRVPDQTPGQPQPAPGSKPQ